MIRNLIESLKSSDINTEPLARKIQKPFFDRVSFYETLSVLLEEQTPIRTALSHMLDVDTDFRQRKGSGALVFVLKDCISATENGEPLGDVLLEWIPVQEAIIIRTGEIKGNISEALRRAAQMANGKKQIVSAIISASVYPVVLLALCFANMYMVRNRLLPEMTRIVPREKWPPTLSFIGGLSDFFIGNGYVLLLVLLGVIFLIKKSVSTYTGWGRNYLDLIPPWSIYRTFQGVTFLFNISSMLQVQIELAKALRLLQRHSDRWLFERLEETRKFAVSGQHLGLALKNSGFDFPSRRCVNQMVLLTEGKGASTALSGYADRWLKEAIKSIKKSAVWITIICLMLVFGYIAGLLMSIYELQSVIQQ
ncbi:type II secretion system F family protein [Pantoea agglomerans]|uniref:type II secretion system F family protein n=1 Tax=Enterobacter agglomerans TaxID=549 RepID=UPI002412EFED|nr:type II secretion system F family protein [Pantoea agglomerans]